MQEIWEIIQAYIPTVIGVLTAIVGILRVIKEFTDKNRDLKESFKAVRDTVTTNEGTMQKILSTETRLAHNVTNLEKTITLMDMKLEKLQKANDNYIKQLEKYEAEQRAKEIEQEQFSKE